MEETDFLLDIVVDKDEVNVRILVWLKSSRLPGMWVSESERGGKGPVHQTANKIYPSERLQK